MTVYIIVNKAEELFNVEAAIGTFAYVTSTSQWYKKIKTKRWAEIDARDAIVPIEIDVYDGGSIDDSDPN